ncbi:hypothetical protein, partial [Lentilactobacillus hilgardii]|uniref:hypothetical protein n=1 Tax=Lentilactobacillus hilgardii TaxID=1588 RepID=UPI0039EB5D99
NLHFFLPKTYIFKLPLTPSQLLISYRTYQLPFSRRALNISNHHMSSLLANLGEFVIKKQLLQLLDPSRVAISSATSLIFVAV